MEAETSEKPEVKRKVSFDTPIETRWRKPSMIDEVKKIHIF